MGFLNLLIFILLVVIISEGYTLYSEEIDGNQILNSNEFNVFLFVIFKINFYKDFTQEGKTFQENFGVISIALIFVIIRIVLFFGINQRFSILLLTLEKVV